MDIKTNTDLGFPLRLFSLGCEPKPKKSINYHSKTEFLEDVENAVGKEVWDNIRESPLGVIVRFVDNKFTWSSKVMEYLLAKQLVCKRKYEIWCLFGNKPARFQASKIVREKSKRETKSGPSLLTPYRGTKPVVGITTKVNQSMAIVGRGYDPFAPVDVQKVKVLDDWLRLDEEYPIGSQQNGVEFFKIIRTPQEWLNEEHINSGMNLLRLRFMKNPKAFRSERIAFTDAYFTTIWSASYQEFLGSKSLPIFPNGAFEYVSRELPAFAKTGKKWKTEVDDIYGVLHVTKNHWVGLFISIPNRSIDVLDCGWKYSKNEDIVTAAKPIAHMLSHLLRAGAPPLERGKMSVEQYKIRRPRTRIPQMQKVGDCGIYAIKFVECHALGAEFTTPLTDADIKMVREKLAAEIFDETEQHGRTVSNPFPFGTNDHELLYTC